VSARVDGDRHVPCSEAERFAIEGDDKILVGRGVDGAEGNDHLGQPRLDLRELALRKAHAVGPTLGACRRGRLPEFRQALASLSSSRWQAARLSSVPVPPSRRRLSAKLSHAFAYSFAAICERPCS